jgi:hypothetical protein
MPCACRPHMPLISLALPSLFHLVIEHLCTPLSTPAPSLRKETHTIGRTRRAHARPERARHAVSAPRRRSGRRSTLPRPIASVLPSLSPLARARPSAPATYWTCSLARGRLVTVAIIENLPRPYRKPSTTPARPRPPLAAPARAVASPSRRLPRAPPSLPLRHPETPRHRRPCPAPSAIPRPYKYRLPLDDFSTPSHSPSPSSSPIPLSLLD